MKRWLCKECGGEVRRKVPIFKVYPVAANGEDDETRQGEIYEDDGNESEFYACTGCDIDTQNDKVELEDIAEYKEVPKQ